MKTIIFCMAILLTCRAYAQWNNNPSTNNPVCSFTSNQINVQLVSDGSGGAICTWIDTRNGTQDIYAQRIDANGSLLWNIDGIAVCNAVSDQYSPRLVSDAAGGAIIAWYDNRAGNYDIYAQRINASGVVQWTIDGVAVCTQTGNQNAQQLVADGSGGAIIAWCDGRVSGPNADIYAQRLDASGSALWTAQGISVCNAASLQNIPQLISDGTGGAIVCWEDWRNFSQSDIYAQRISFNGFTTWSFNGISICSEPNFAHQYNTKIISDGAGGVIICWLDQRNAGSGQDIYAQRVNGSGTIQWTSNGLSVCNATALQTAEQMITDGAGGAILTWEDRRSGQADIYSQRLNTSGAAQWTANGIAVCNATGIQNEVQIIPRLSGGVILIWTDLRNSSQEDIYAQALTLAGAALWTANGVPVANEPHSQFAPHMITDGGDGGIIAWQDLRTTFDYDIYSSKLFSDGTLPVKLISFTAALQNKNALLQWQTANELNVTKYNIQRSVDGNTFNSIGSVAATGNSATVKNYSYTDITLGQLNAPRVYFRLQVTDADGKTYYSNIEMVNTAIDITLTVSPNPVHDDIFISCGENTGLISIINTKGQVVKSISLSGILSRQKIDIKELPAGLYFIRVMKEKQVYTKQFIKQ